MGEERRRFGGDHIGLEIYIGLEISVASSLVTKKRGKSFTIENAWDHVP
jgi:hypothetical protein